MRAITPIANRSLIFLHGPDKSPFLQGLMSNDVNKIGPRQSIYAAFLTGQGKFLHDLFLGAMTDQFWLDIETDRRADFLKKLQLYKLRSAISVDDAAHRYRIYGLWGGDGLNGPDAPGATQIIDDCVLYRDPRLAAMGWRLIAPAHYSLEALAEKFSAKQQPWAEYDYNRAALGLPDGSRDIEIDRGIILENGLDELRGIDWDKGCYLGQELTARTRYRGLIRKRLLPCIIQQPPATPIAFGSAVLQDGKEVGESRSFIPGIGTKPPLVMVLLRLEALKNPHPLYIGDMEITPQIPNWVQLPAPETA
jgi:folate-binding protein YgfZ